MRHLNEDFLMGTFDGEFLWAILKGNSCILCGESPSGKFDGDMRS